MQLNPADTDFLTALSAALPGVVHPMTDRYLEEPRGKFTGAGAVVLKPRNTSEVAEILRRANAARIGVVPYGGGTGLVGGQVGVDLPAPLVLSLERMNAITDVDAEDRSLLAGAGAILADIQAAAAEIDLLFPLSLASEGSCRIGGNLATNAGGVNVIRYGNAREQVLGVEAVLADGTIVRDLKSLRKDNTGYDIGRLLVGSEGTLGIITAARLKLVDRPKERMTALLDVGTPEGALRLLRHVQTRFGELVTAFELIDRGGVDFIAETMPDTVLPPIGEGAWFVLTDIGGGSGANLSERFEMVLAEAMDAGMVTDGFIAQSEAQRDQIWTMRESMPEANRRIGAIASHDISIPVGRVPEFIAECRARLQSLNYPFRINSFGHMGDGNLHFNLFPAKGDNRNEQRHLGPKITRIVHDLTAEFGGSFSAEHGVGRLKKSELVTYGDPGKRAAMAAIKAALDPNGILNPGAIFDD